MLPIGYFSPVYRQTCISPFLPAATDDEMGIGANVMPGRCLVALPAPPANSAQLGVGMYQ
jgi:hypothetical protein